MELTSNYTAVLTAFMYSGAISSTRRTLRQMDWRGGHIGFVHECTRHAAAISEALDKALLLMPDVDYPGVMEYQLIEPLGLWLAEQGGWVEPRVTAARFLRQFRKWVRE